MTRADEREHHHDDHHLFMNAHTLRGTALVGHFAHQRHGLAPYWLSDPCFCGRLHMDVRWVDANGYTLLSTSSSAQRELYLASCKTCEPLDAAFA
jgi:hypothetical protein